MAVAGGLNAISVILPRLESAVGVFVNASFVAAFIGALAGCLLAPHTSSWRLLRIDDVAALRPAPAGMGAAGLDGLTLLLREINRAARTSQVSTG